MMTVFQGRIVKICVSSGIMDDLLPCSLSERPSSGGEGSNGTHATPEVSGGHRRLLAEEAAAGYCAAKVSLLTKFGLGDAFSLLCSSVY